MALHYLSLPPSAHAEVIKALGTLGLATRSRIILEKPFGTDLTSAQGLDALLHSVFEEEQIFQAHNSSVTSRLDPSLSLDALPGPPDGGLPAFVRGSSLTEGAFRMARAAHGRFGHGDTDIDHPIAVAELLSGKGFDETVVAAALLHDTVEDTTLTTEEIAQAFGDEVATLVAEVTEDPQIEAYPARKAEARSRVMRDRRAAAIYAADKLANTRELLAGHKDVRGERLDHYIKTLRFLSDGRPDLPFLSELSEELTKLVDREPAA